MKPALELVDGRLSFGRRTLWSGLDLTIEPGQFVTVLGPNGSGKSSLLKAILGLIPLSAGRVRIAGLPARRGRSDVGYIPQHRGGAPTAPLRGRDLVQLGIDGNKWGLPRPRKHRARVDELLERVGAAEFAHLPLGRLSGGEHQLLRIAQAIATDPAVLLCDEPLLSLDLRHQHRVVDLLEAQRREQGTAIIFVTHEINPVLPVTDQVLYLTDGAFRLGAVDEVMTSRVLSALYRAPVEVLRRQNQIIVLGADDGGHDHHQQTIDPHEAAPS